MNRFLRPTFLLCGLILTLAALPVFAQKQEEAEGRLDVNRIPLQDFVKYLKEVANGKVDLTKPFLVELEGNLSKDGRLDAGKSKFIRSEGDAQLVDVAKRFMIAIGDSYCFHYLGKLGVEKLDFTIAQDDNTLSIVVKSEVLTVEKAKTIAIGLNTMISVAKTKVIEDEKILVDALSVMNRGKEFIINFVLPKSVAQEMLKRKLQETERKETMLNSR